VDHRHTQGDPQTGDHQRDGPRHAGRTRRASSHTRPLPKPDRQRHQPGTSVRSLAFRACLSRAARKRAWPVLRGGGAATRRRYPTNGGSPNCSGAAWTAACSARSTSSPPRWKAGSRPGTPAPGRSSGPRPPTRSSTASAATAHASLDRETRLQLAAGASLAQSEPWVDSQQGQDITR
jgi:hypothetical protein